MRRAFTVGELIIALAIVAIIAAVAIPNLVESHRRSDSSTSPNGRFKVEPFGGFLCSPEDRENRRAIYVVTDTATGVQYLAVQGCGTSQLIVEQHGKTPAPAER